MKDGDKDSFHPQELETYQRLCTEKEENLPKTREDIHALLERLSRTDRKIRKVTSSQRKRKQNNHYLH